MRIAGGGFGITLAGIGLAAALGVLALAVRSPAAPKEPKCNGKQATYVGTDGRDRIRDDGNKDPELGKNPVLVLRGGRDVVNLEGNFAAITSLTICAGPGDDKVELFEGIGAKSYWVDGGPGDDEIGNSSPYIEEGFLENLTLRGGKGHDDLLGGSFPDKLIGGDGSDRVDAGNGDDVVRGGAGNDKLFGEGHDDRLYGDAGDDKLVGDSAFHQPGKDRADGGKGKDRCKAEIKVSCER